MTARPTCGSAFIDGVFGQDPFEQQGDWSFWFCKEIWMVSDYFDANRRFEHDIRAPQNKTGIAILEGVRDVFHFAHDFLERGLASVLTTLLKVFPASFVRKNPGHLPE
jgi:hypothetical protein